MTAVMDAIGRLNRREVDYFSRHLSPTWKFVPQDRFTQITDDQADEMLSLLERRTSYFEFDAVPALTYMMSRDFPVTTYDRWTKLIDKILS